MAGVPLDALITRMLARSPFDYRVAVGDSEREVAYRLCDAGPKRTVGDLAEQGSGHRPRGDDWRPDPASADTIWTYGL